MIYLDHVGVIGSSIELLRQQWQAKGFFVTEPEELMAVDSKTGQRISLGQHSCHIILEQGYIELTAVNTVTPSHHLFPWIRNTESLGIIAIGTNDIEGVHARVLTADVPACAIASASRPIHYGTRRGEALFRWFALGAAVTPEALICFVSNERPELIYQPEVQRHANGASTLESVIICADEPESVAQRYGAYLYTTPQRVASDMFRCSLDRGSVWIGTPSAIEAVFGQAIDCSIDKAPRAIGFGVAPTQIYWASTTG
jgi:hypothetical protein